VSSIETSTTVPEAAAWPSLTRIASVALTAAAIVAVAARHGFALEFVPAAAFLVTLGVVSVIDFEQRRIPNVIVLPAAAVALVLVALLQPGQVKAAIIGGVGASLFFLIPALVAPRAVGAGDAKLALLIGVVLGVDVVQALIITSFAAGAVAAGLIVAGGSNRKRTIPLGPFFAAGGAFALIASGGCFYP
jgi:leader peptidase (prepilin peptidase)/N-methyltransferase